MGAALHLLQFLLNSSWNLQRTVNISWGTFYGQSSLPCHGPEFVRAWQPGYYAESRFACRLEEFKAFSVLGYFGWRSNIFINSSLGGSSFSNDDTVNQYSPPRTYLTNRKREDTILLTNHKSTDLCRPMGVRASHVNTDHQTQLSRSTDWPNIILSFSFKQLFQRLHHEGGNVQYWQWVPGGPLQGLQKW